MIVYVTLVLTAVGHDTTTETDVPAGVDAETFEQAGGGGGGGTVIVTVAVFDGPVLSRA
jgi:hypothetical protein